MSQEHEDDQAQEAKQAAPVETEPKPEEETKVSEESEGEESEGEESEGEESEGEESEGEESKGEESKGEESAQPKKQGGFKRKLVKRDEEIEQLKAKLAVYEQPTETKALSAKPEADSYESYEEYIDALTDWKIQKREKDVQEQRQQLLAQNALQQRVTTLQAKVQEYKESTPDFDEVLKSVDDVTLSPAVQQSLLASDNGPALMYALAKDRQQLERINTLPPIDAAFALATLNAGLAASTPTSSPAKKASTAPPPAEDTAQARSGKSVSKDPDDMDYEEYLEWRKSNS